MVSFLYENRFKLIQFLNETGDKVLNYEYRPWFKQYGGHF
jgi:hypothetical protein